ncbi:MAG: hypothetical protein AAF942_00140 [Pseudomonadota bacterium]
MSGIKGRVDATRQQEESARLEAEEAEKKADDAKAADDDEEEEETPEGDKKAEEKSEAGEGDEEEKEDAAANAREAAAEISSLCADAGVPNLAASLIKDGCSVDEAKERIEGAADIRGLVACARRINPAIDAKFADDLIAAGASGEHARAQLFDMIVSKQSEDIQSAFSSSGGAQRADNGVWDRELKSTNSRIEGEGVSHG